MGSSYTFTFLLDPKARRGRDRQTGSVLFYGTIAGTFETKVAISFRSGWLPILTRLYRVATRPNDTARSP